MEMKLYEILRDFMIQNAWDNGVVSEQARAMFTTICIVGDIEADTFRCNSMLRGLYEDAAMGYVMSYDKFEEYMISLIV